MFSKIYILCIIIYVYKSFSTTLDKDLSKNIKKIKEEIIEKWNMIFYFYPVCFTFSISYSFFLLCHLELEVLFCFNLYLSVCLPSFSVCPPPVPFVPKYVNSFWIRLQTWCPFIPKILQGISTGVNHSSVKSQQTSAPDDI